MNMIVGFEILHMALWIRDLDFLSYRSTSLSALNDSWNFKFFTSVCCISCWRGIFVNVVKLFKGNSFFNCFHKGLPGFSWKTVTAYPGHLHFLTTSFYSDGQNCQKPTQWGKMTQKSHISGSHFTFFWSDTATYLAKSLQYLFIVL